MEYIENLIIKHFDPLARTMRLFCETFKNSRLTLPTEELICQFFQPTNELLKQFMEELNNKSEKKSRQVFQGLIVKKKTDVDFFQTISEVFEQPWCFRNLGNLPKRGDIIFVVTDNIKDGIISVCEVTSERPLPVKGLIGIELSDLEDR